MQWKHPEYNTRIIVKKFAFFPVYIYLKNTTVWLEHYYLVRRRGINDWYTDGIFLNRCDAEKYIRETE
jgi:hypothetical protein